MSLSAIHVESVPDYQSALAHLRKEALVVLLDQDPEGWSCLQGLLAMLRLPATEEGRQHMEIDRGDELGWMPLDRVQINRDAIVFAKGHNGSTETFTVHAGSPMPRWRIAAGPTTMQVPHYI